MRKHYKNREIDEKFFFAMEDVEYYDDTIGMTVPHYSLIIQTLIDIIKYHYITVKKSDRVNGIILDVGAGTGKESLSVLKNFDYLKVLAVDLCAPMKHVFDDNYKLLFGDKLEKRYRYIVSDINEISVSDDSVITYLLENNRKGCSVVMSAYCIHHFTLKQKEEVYKKMFEFLEPGGILINMDLFNYESMGVRNYAHQFDLRYIKDQFESPTGENKVGEHIPISIRKRLRDKWVSHMQNDNVLDSVESQLQILKNIGYNSVECIFKYWQQGIIIAKKPA